MATKKTTEMQISKEGIFKAHDLLALAALGYEVDIRKKDEEPSEEEEALLEIVQKQTKIQTLIFDKKKFTGAQAKRWAKDHGFRSTGVDETGGSFRYRQMNPGDFSRMRTISLRDGVKAVVGPLKKYEAEKAEVEKVYGAAPEKLQICKLDAVNQIVYGIVLEPNVEDAQDDWMSEEDIQKAAHFFMKESRTIGFVHKKKAKAELVESYLSPVNWDVEGPYGKQRVTKGTWVLGVHAADPATWNMIENGEIQAFSVGGFGKRS